jgi:hypothetical protein
MISPASQLRLLTLLCAIFAPGCVATMTDRDVSAEEKFLIGYQPGQVYQTAKPLSIIEADGNQYLWPADTVFKRSRPVGTLAEGSRIRIDSLRHRVIAAPIQWESRVDVAAHLADRPDRVIILQGISSVRWINGDHGMLAPILMPDPKWLKLVSPR